MFGMVYSRLPSAKLESFEDVSSNLDLSGAERLYAQPRSFLFALIISASLSFRRNAIFSIILARCRAEISICYMQVYETFLEVPTLMAPSMDNLTQHFSYINYFRIKAYRELNLVRALDEDTRVSSSSLLLHWARQLFLGISPLHQ